MNYLKNYYQPTPKNMRKLGDALLSISVFVTTSAISNNNHTLAYTALILGVIGKFLTNIFVDK